MGESMQFLQRGKRVIYFFTVVPSVAPGQSTDPDSVNTTHEKVKIERSSLTSVCLPRRLENIR